MVSQRLYRLLSRLAHRLAGIAGRMVLVGLALLSLTVMLLTAGGALAAGMTGPAVVRRPAVRIRQLPPLATPAASPTVTTADFVTLAGGWEVTELQLPTVTPTVTPAPAPDPTAARPEPPDPEPVFTGWPTGGRVTQGFGCSPFYSGIPGPNCDDAAPWFHDGLDIANLAGAPVRAVLTGTVVFAGPDSAGPVCGQYRGYGLSVIIEDGQGHRALYAHQSKLAVTAGQPVSPDTLIGAVGATGCTSGPHLHLGLQVGGRATDPLERMTADAG